jgi:hypothetical protein
MDNNLVNDPRCFEFCTEHPEECVALVNTKCVSENLDTEACKKFCFSSQTSYDCTTQLLDHCTVEQNQGQDICACFLPTEVYDQYYEDLFGGKASNAQSVINQINKLPSCSYGPCSAGQFKPRIQQVCPPQAICVQSIEITADGQIYFKGDPNFQQNCEILLGTGSNTASNAPPPPPLPTWMILVIAAAVIVGLTAIVIGVVYGLRNARLKKQQTVKV